MANNEIAIADLDGRKAYNEFFAAAGLSRECLASGINTIVDAATTLSIEIAWPVILKLSRKVEEGDIELSSGWTIKSVKVPSGPHSAFVMENADEPGGFLFDVLLRPAMTDEARDRIAAIKAEKMKAVDAIPDREVREAARESLLAITPEEVSAIQRDSASYRDHGDCETVRAVSCTVYRADGLFPPGYNGAGSELDDTLALIAQEAFAMGKLFESRPSALLQFGQVPPYLSFDPSGYVRDPAMTLVAFEVLSEALYELDLVDELSERIELIQPLKYLHHSVEPGFGLLMQMGFDTVTTSGLPGEKALGTAVHYWTAATAIDVTRAAKGLPEAVRKLEERGHTDVGNPFAFRMFDEAFVADVGNGKGKTLWVGSGTLSGCFRVDFEASDDSDVPILIKAAIVPHADRPGREPHPDTRGFLFEFEVQDSEGYWPLEIAEFEGRNLEGAFRLCGLLDKLKEHLAKAD